MAEKKDVIKGMLGKSESYKTTDDTQTELEKAKALNEEAGLDTSSIEERVEPKPLPIPATMPEITPQRGLASSDPYARMAEKLTTAMGPSQEYPSNALGVFQGLASGLTPESSIAQGKLLESQDKAAMDLYKLQGKQKQESRLRMPATEFSKLSDELNTLQRNRKATDIIRKWALSEDRKPINQKLGLLKGVAKKVKYWLLGKSSNMTPDQARAMAYYWNYVNSEIKRITGAQMSEPEARRLMRQMSDPYASPKTFLDVWDDIMEDNERALLRKITNYRIGNWHGVEGLLPQYEEISADPYQRTAWPEKLAKMYKQKAANRKKVGTEIKRFDKKTGKTAVFRNRKFIRWE
jgi:hypothetical protein